MGWTDYSSVATTIDEVLKERLKKAAFHYSEWRENENSNSNEKVEYDFIDVAVLLGIRECCYKQEGDRPLTREEIVHFLKVLDRPYAIFSYLSPEREDTTIPLDTLVSMFNEWTDRLVIGSVNEKDDGSVEASLDSMTYMGLWRALTRLYPGAEMEVWEYADYDDGEDWSLDSCHFIVSHGAKELIGEEHSPTCKESQEEKDSKKKEPTIYSVGMELAYKGEFEKSIVILKTIENDGNPDVLNNIGVNYERLGQYKKAYDYYLKANTAFSLNNLLNLCDHRRVSFHEKVFINICHRVIKLGDFHGYVYLSKFYSGFYDEQYKDPDVAIQYAKEGYGLYKEKPYMVFQYAWCLTEFAKTNVERQLAHSLYESILNNMDDEDGTVFATARHNYAYQCQEGFGCDTDINKAIYWYIRSYEGGYASAAYKLYLIYRDREGYKDPDVAAYWNNKYEQKEGNGD